MDDFDLPCECGDTEACDECFEFTHEADMDRLLEQQELEDFEQADEYFNHYDYHEEW
jgi:hypothetical protein